MKIGRYKSFFILVAVCILSATFLISCKPTVPEQYIQPDELENILYDYYITQALANQGHKYDNVSFNKNLYYNAILKKYGITEAEFDSSMVYYYANADRLYDIYVKLSRRLSNEAIGLGASVGDMNKFSQLDADGDTADIWNEASNMVLMPIPPYNKFSFTIKADSTFMQGDSFLFNFMNDFMFQAGTKDAVIYIAMHYKNDSVSTHVNRIGVSGISQLRIPGNANDEIESINGFIYLNRGNDDSRTLKLMFISRIQFIRFHADKKQNSILNSDSLINVSDTLPPRRLAVNKQQPDSTGKIGRLIGLKPIKK